MDCIILAGSGENYREIEDSDNKAFLEVRGTSILHLILRQLQRVPMVDRIHIVGPKQRLEKHLQDIDYPADGKPLICYQEGANILANVMTVYAATGSDPQRQFLVMPSDVPLITAGEINQFLARCDLENFDLQTGMTTAAALARFKPEVDRPGVEMSTFSFRDLKVRVNNLHLVRPGGAKYADYVRRLYAYRYQKRWYNVFGVFFMLLQLMIRLPRGIEYYFYIQGARVARERGWSRLASWFANRIHVPTGEKMISRGLGTRFRLVITDLGGSAIDVDNDQDYHAIQARFDEWHQMQEQLAKEWADSESGMDVAN